RVDVDAVLACVTPATRIVIIANPNNPTGTYIPASEVRRLHRALSPDVLLLLDSAYCEYVAVDDYEDGSALARQHGNVVMTRTFSKIYGLAGLRIGWAYAPLHVIDALQRIRTPFNANRAALAAAAEATRDVEHVANVRHKNKLAQQYVSEQLARLGLRHVPSVTNFYLIDFDGIPGKSAREAAVFLQSRGVIPRPIKSGRGENRLRITIGREHENEAALAALRDYLGNH
ncbi:MAG TPA: histidinol-phosphate transaminase, partial [Steroidobacter sp.]